MRGVMPDPDMQLTGQFAGVASDSRDVRPGYLFVAIPGAKMDGAVFIRDAVERGATGVMALPGEAELVASLGMRFFPTENPRLSLAKLAATFYGPAPEHVAAVTGTNGKTSVTVFLREIWTALGFRAASLGTIGVISPDTAVKLSNTTPGPVELHHLLRDLTQDSISHVAMEASSHGLDQFRLDGVCPEVAGFTNLTRDHLDYHPSFEAYRDAKLRLFCELLPDGGAAVINADADVSEDVCARIKAAGRKVLSVGEKGEFIRLLHREPAPGGQFVRIGVGGMTYEVLLPLVGAFQASNALIAAGMAIAMGADPEQVCKALTNLRGAPGRMEKVAISRDGAPVYVDYAHTPDGLSVVLQAMRPHVSGKLVVVFGCGGDRDHGKRPLMGKIAAELADRVIVTDDNPRTEDPSDIRAQVLEGCPGAEEFISRASAIRDAISSLAAGDVLVIAGKGHETGQIIGHEVRPFSDREEAVKSAIALGGTGIGGVV